MSQTKDRAAHIGDEGSKSAHISPVGLERSEEGSSKSGTHAHTRAKNRWKLKQSLTISSNHTVPSKENSPLCVAAEAATELLHTKHSGVERAEAARGRGRKGQIGGQTWERFYGRTNVPDQPLPNKPTKLYSRPDRHKSPPSKSREQERNKLSSSRLQGESSQSPPTDSHPPIDVPFVTTPIFTTHTIYRSTFKLRDWRYISYHVGYLREYTGFRRK